MKPERTDQSLLTSLMVGPITVTDLVRYQGASGDFNSIHHDAVKASAAGLPSVIAPGMYVAGLMSRCLLADYCETEVRGFATKFLAPVHLGDALEITGTRLVADQHGDVSIELRCVNQDGVVVATAVARVVA